MQTSSRTHEENGEEHVALRVAPGLAWFAPFFDAVDYCDNQRKNHWQHNNSQCPLAGKADEAETLAAPEGSE